MSRCHLSQALQPTLSHVRVCSPCRHRSKRNKCRAPCFSPASEPVVQLASSHGVGSVSSNGTSTSQHDKPAKSYGGLERPDFEPFVRFFRQASSYIEGHRGRTFVVVLPGEVLQDTEVLYPLLEDVALLHGLGINLVLVLGARRQINESLQQAGRQPQYVGGCRVTDELAMKIAVQAAGTARMAVEARLSKGPTIQMVRRHTRSSSHQHYGPALQIVSGNYVTAKRKGVIDGVDFQSTGTVRFVQVDAVKRQLNDGNIVILSNLGYSAAGEVLNCDTYTVAVRAAIDLQADKLMVVTLPDTQPLALPNWLPLSEAERLLKSMVVQNGNGATEEEGPRLAVDKTQGSNGNGRADHTEPEELDFDRWHKYSLPIPLIAACTVCQHGVTRAHLVDGRTDGALLLELYSRDGVGCMISTDFYMGMRAAEPADIWAMEALLKPLEEKGVLAPRSHAQLAAELPHFTVSEQEHKILGCAMVKPLGRDGAGEAVAELAAFCIHPNHRGTGRGDSLLQYLEQEAKAKGVNRLVLLTTRTAGYFEQRGFKPAGPAHASALLPDARREQVNPARNSQLYYKTLEQPMESSASLVGKRIGY